MLGRVLAIVESQTSMIMLLSHSSRKFSHSLFAPSQWSSKRISELIESHTPALPCHSQYQRYQEALRDENGIVRDSTTKQTRWWELPRTHRALEALMNELGKIAFPGLYLLF